MTKITIFEAKYVITWIRLMNKLKYPEKEENIQFFYQFTLQPAESPHEPNHILLTLFGKKGLYKNFVILKLLLSWPLLGLSFVITFFIDNGGKKEVLTQCLVHCFTLLSKGREKKNKTL